MASIGGRPAALAGKSQQPILYLLGERLVAPWTKLSAGGKDPALASGAAGQLHQIDRLVQHGAGLLRIALEDQGRRDVPKLGARHLDQLYGVLVRSGLSSTTVLQLHRVLHHALRDAVRWNLIDRNVAELVTPRKARHDFTTFSPAQARRFLDAVKGDRLEALHVLALTTGCAKASCSASDGPPSTSTPARCTSSGS
jgi:hypothetical protein